jgi:hypothetical protein
VEVRENFQVEISNTFASVTTLVESGEINRAWGDIGESNKTSSTAEAT